MVVEPHWRAELHRARALILSRDTAKIAAAATTTEVDPVLLEVFANLFMAIAKKWA